MKRLAIVVPCYNEEEILFDTNDKLNSLLFDLRRSKKIAPNSYILYVDDGSKDKTWSIIEGIVYKNVNVKGLKLASNSGHQNAVFAGLMYAKEEVDITITIDADLQDDIDVIEEMIDKNNNGAEIVYGVRNDRQTDTFFKRFTAELFYKFISSSNSKSIPNSADFRLMSKTVLDELEKYSEYDLYLRGIVPNLGYKQDAVYYARKEREKGETKYTLTKMIKLAMDGFTSSNASPLFILFPFSFILFLISFILLIKLIIVYIKIKSISFIYLLLFIIFLLFAILFISLAIFGQYLGRTYIQSKNRPRYFVEKVIGRNKK